MIQQRFYIYWTKWKLINWGMGSSQSIINICDKEKWCLCHTNNANTKLMGKLLFLIYYLMDFFSAVCITHYDINFNSYSLKSPWGGRGRQKNMLSVQPKNSHTMVQSNGLERNMITVPVTLGYSCLSFFQGFAYPRNELKDPYLIALSWWTSLNRNCSSQLN